MRVFEQRVLFLGFGAVAPCTLPILMDHLKVDPRRVTLMDQPFEGGGGAA